jgi:hypothetical protein
MQNLTISIPHRLTRDEVRRRIQGELATIRKDHGSLVRDLREDWTGDRLDFSASAVGQAIRGHLVVEDQLVHVEVELPWLFALLAGTVKRQIEHQGRLLLGGPRADQTPS